MGVPFAVASFKAASVAGVLPATILSLSVAPYFFNTSGRIFISPEPASIPMILLPYFSAF
jgi:hypothetical protein